MGRTSGGPLFRTHYRKLQEEPTGSDTLEFMAYSCHKCGHLQRFKVYLKKKICIFIYNYNVPSQTDTSTHIMAKNGMLNILCGATCGLNSTTHLI